MTDSEGPAHDCALWAKSTGPMHSYMCIFRAGLDVGVALWKSRGESKTICANETQFIPSHGRGLEGSVSNSTPRAQSTGAANSAMCIVMFTPVSARGWLQRRPHTNIRPRRRRATNRSSTQCQWHRLGSALKSAPPARNPQQV